MISDRIVNERSYGLTWAGLAISWLCRRRSFNEVDGDFGAVLLPMDGSDCGGCFSVIRMNL